MQIPSELIVLRPGRNAVEGHADVLLDDAAGYTIMANHYKNRGGAARPIDVDHATLLPAARGADGLAPAVGWIEGLRFEPSRGVIAQVTFNTAGRAHLAAGRYRAFSPTILLGRDGRPVELHSIALTNQPRMVGTSLLAASHGAGGSIPLCDGRRLVCCSAAKLPAAQAASAARDPFLIEGDRVKRERGCNIGDAYALVARERPELYTAYKAGLIAAGGPAPRREAVTEAPAGQHPYLLKAAEIKTQRGLTWSSAYSATCREFPELFASYTGRA